MEKLLDFIKKSRAIISAFVAFGVFSIGTYKIFIEMEQRDNINKSEIEYKIKEIDGQLNVEIKEIEMRQMHLLKHLSSIYEYKNLKKKIKSNEEWDEYLFNHYNIYKIQLKYNLIPEGSDWKPMERKR